MSAATDIIVPIVTALCGGGAMKALEWYGKQREAVRLAAESAATRKAEADKTANDDIVSLMREQNAAAESRGERAAERAVTIANALQAAATSQADLSREVARIPDALDALARRLESVERAVMDRDRPSTPVDSHRSPTGVS